MQIRIAERLRGQHAAILEEYVGLVTASNGDNPSLQDLARRIGELEVALERLDRGAYGTCLLCGGHIGQARLVRMPLTDHCARCSRETPPSGE